MKNIVESSQLHNREFVFADREEAGRQLGDLVGKEAGDKGLLLAIPSGGVPVAAAMLPFLPWPLDLLLVRKVQIPWNTEAGFGAVNLDGDRFFNQRLLKALHLTDEVVESQISKALRTIEQRNELFRGGRPFADIAGKDVIIVDDGLASGYTMLAALQYARRRKPASLAIAVPTGLLETVENLAARVERLYCLNIREATPFAVASAYRNWFDETDAGIVELLERLNEGS
ncbi:MAG: phosphoribosyltransferase [Proteobacteria bacterium]|nr:phosphoribosyltransferase [Pseudomonadota bacterium]MBU4296325.1 phosphoribosyltransferase [Pseudomonadota bacterium]MCG2746569.1 phosphoribosyltransferase [Desulfobulbaceae bacterium]